MRGRPSPLNDHVEAIYAWIKADKSIADIVDLCKSELGIKTQDSAVRGVIKRYRKLSSAWQERKVRRRAEQIVSGQMDAPGVLVNEDIIIITGEPGVPVEQIQIEDILERRGLDPEEWEVAKAMDNQWEANAGRDPETGLPTKITLFQYKLWLNRKTPLEVVYPAYVGPKLPPPRKPDLSEPVLTVVVTDQQCPFRNEELHQLFLRWLAKNQPAQGVSGGDLLDNGDVSRHRDDPAWHRSVQECIQSGFDTLYDYRNASLDTKWWLIKGNHDDRIRNEQLERNERLYGVSAAQYPGDEPEEWVYSLNHLLHLPKLGIDYVEPKGTYEFMQVPLTDIIAVRHGHRAGKNQKNAMITAEEFGHSVVLGHTHRQSINRKTRWNSISGEWHVLTGIEAGSMCINEGGLGYANAGSPDWQPGFATVTTFPDGGFTCELATFEQPGILRWRDQVYSL